MERRARARRSIEFQLHRRQSEREGGEHFPPSFRRLSLGSFLYSERGREQFSVARGAASILPLHSVGNLVAMPRQQFGSTQVACFRIQEIRFVLKQAPAIRANEVLFSSYFQGYLYD